MSGEGRVRGATPVYDRVPDEWHAECAACEWVAQPWRSLAMAREDAEAHSCQVSTKGTQGAAVSAAGRAPSREVMCSHPSERHGFHHPEGLCPHVVRGQGGRLTAWPCPARPGAERARVVVLLIPDEDYAWEVFDAASDQPGVRALMVNADHQGSVASLVAEPAPAREQS